MNISPSLIRQGFLHAAGVALYTSLVGSLMFNAERFFGGKPDTVLAPISVLTLLVLSVGIVGCLIFLKPILVYLDGQKAEAVKLVVATLVWLAIITALLIIFQLLF